MAEAMSGQSSSNTFNQVCSSLKICRYPSSVRQQQPTHADLERVYGEQNHMWRVLAKCKRSGQVHYQVMWQPTFMVVSHVEEYQKIQYTPDDVQKVTQFGLGLLGGSS